jgi:hypothetical protein
MGKSCLLRCISFLANDIPFAVGVNLRQLRQTLQQVYAAKQSLAITEDLVEQLKADEELCRNINSCAQNQSRIADDVLALARINLDMLHFVMVSMASAFASFNSDHTLPNRSRR